MSSSSTPELQPSSARGPGVPPALVLALGVLCVSTGSLFVRAADAPPLVKAAWRCSIATLVIWPGAATSFARDRRVVGARAFRLAALAGAFLAVHFATWIASIDHASVAASTLLVNTTPVWVALVGPLVTTDRVEKRVFLGGGLALLGIVVLGLMPEPGGETTGLGYGLALCGGLAAAGYMLVARRLGSALAFPTYLLVCYGTAAGLLVGATLASGASLVGYSLDTVLALCGLALVPQICGHSALNWCLRRLPATVVALGALAEPVFASLLAWWFLAEAPPRAVLAAAPFLLVGIGIAISRPRRPSSARRVA